MESAITKRIKEFISYKGIRISLFERNCGLANGYVNQIKRAIGDEKLKVISDRYPDLNIAWVLTGIGEMLNTRGGESEIEDNIAENGDYNENMIKRMKDVVRQRIMLIIQERNISVSSLSGGDKAFQRKLNRQINEGAVITIETISSILETFPDLSAEWLLRGEGPMLKSDAPNKEETETLKKFLKQTDALLAIRDERIRKLELENAALISGSDIKKVG